ncbi:MAG: hypothetical protein JXR73_05815 [Candidatus Omnitrophica bacterium]|nr:hypothetical protein [Candidatus Omnitrophota bacterium]
MLRKISLLILAACFLSQTAVSQDVIKDGLKVWTTAWDNGQPDNYYIFQWTYNAADQTWKTELQWVVSPEFAGEEWNGSVYDMGMDMITHPGGDDLYAVLTVSKGDSHFPSQGTEFQLRKLVVNNDWPEWELVQDPLFTTPADVSPLGVDVYYDAGQLHIAWTEDNDEAGPNSMMCEIFDQAYTVNSDGTLAASGDKTLVFSHRLNWGGTNPGVAGVTGLTVCDYDGDGDMDFVIGDMYYGESPAGVAIQLIERLGPDEWSADVQDLFYGSPGHGAEGVCYCDIDGDEYLDLVMTSGSSYPWNNVVWFEKAPDGSGQLDEVGVLVDCSTHNDENYPSVSNQGHIFGLYVPSPASSTLLDHWSLY